MASMLLEIFSVSPRGFESFTRRFGSPFGAIFKRVQLRTTGLEEEVFAHSRL